MYQQQNTKKPFKISNTAQIIFCRTWFEASK